MYKKRVTFYAWYAVCELCRDQVFRWSLDVEYHETPPQNTTKRIYSPPFRERRNAVRWAMLPGAYHNDEAANNSRSNQWEIYYPSELTE